MEHMALIALLLSYMLPALIASSRKHRNTTAIGVLCLLLGWTGIGWVACLVWAFTCNARDAE